MLLMKRPVGGNRISRYHGVDVQLILSVKEQREIKSVEEEFLAAGGEDEGQDVPEERHDKP